MRFRLEQAFGSRTGVMGLRQFQVVLAYLVLITTLVVCVSIAGQGKCVYTWRHVLIEGGQTISKVNQTSAELKMTSRINSSAMNPSHFVRTLSGVQMPKLIYGTAWKKEKTADLVVKAVQKGFRGIDTAGQPKHYNESGVGEALKRLMEEDGIKREDLFIQTKFTPVDGQDPDQIPYDKNVPLTAQVQESLKTSLKNLGTSYIDSLVMHSPMNTMDETLEVWKVFETFVDDGRVKQLGISNCYFFEIKKLFEEARIKPSVVQNRLHGKARYDKEIRQFCKEKGIYYQSFWTLSGNPHILLDQKVREMSQSYKKTPAEMVFTYLIQTGVVTPLTGTSDPEHMEHDLSCLDMPELQPQEKLVFDKLFLDK